MITVSGNIQDILGNAVIGGLAVVTVQLCGYGAQIPRTAGAMLGQTWITAVPGAGGAFTVTLYGNDAITPAGTYYTFSAGDTNGAVCATNAYQFTGSAAVNLNSAPGYSPVPPSLVPVYPLVVVPYAATIVFPAINAAVVTYKLVLTGNVTASAMQTLSPGQVIAFDIEQDSVGGHTFAWPPNARATTPVVAAANARTLVLFTTLDDSTLDAVLGSQGPTGPPGATGNTGATGAAGTPGAAATVAVGTTTTGAAGTSAAVTNSGTSAAAVLNFTVPQGVQGATGATGATGASGTTGSPGTPGAAATVAVGTTTTGAAGTSAAVTNSGTSTAAVLNFTVPQGVQGATGATGATGASGATGLPTATGAGQFPVATGSGTTYTARALVSADIPGTIASNTTGTAANVTGTVAIANGGTGATTAAAALTALGAFPAAGGTITGATTVNGTVLFYYGTTFYAGVQIQPGTGNAFTVTGATVFVGTVFVNGYAVTGTGINILTPSATPTYDGTNGSSFKLALTAAVTGGTLANLIAGSLYVMQIQQGATAYAYAWPSGLTNTTAVVPQANKTVYQLIYATSPTTAVAVAPLATP